MPVSSTQPAHLAVTRDGNGKIYSHVRRKWLDEIPEETVRQEYLCTLVNEYGYSLDQISEEMEVTGRGSGHARADFVIWRTPADKAATPQRSPLIIVECKSDNVTISVKDYAQGDNYARLTNARFFVTHNSRETKYWRVVHDIMPKYPDEIENIPHANASNKEIEEIIARLKVFKEDEFADLLHVCHNIIRNREKLDPAAAFDEIAKILFVKVWVEREMKRKRQRQNLFTAEWLDTQLGDHPLDVLFQQTKEAYKTDYLFAPDERIKLKFPTGREIVARLEKYNLSDTSEDIKGIAFERFLGRTFRGEIGQFFTPRTIVEFMVHMIEPKEGEVVCDPASGSGGFLIRWFEIVREQILADADRQYQQYKVQVDVAGLSEAEKAERLRAKYNKIQMTLRQDVEYSRLWSLSNRCIYGTDANDRMARTSKMNMIMHGDGHGGVHHHDGFLNVNGIFEGRFDVILTNPPFGADVDPTDVVEEEAIRMAPDVQREYEQQYGDAYLDAQARVRAALGKPIATLFELPRITVRKDGQMVVPKVKTELLFMERCLSLLKPGGRLGIVLPEGVFNNPSLIVVREYIEDRAFVRAVVSLPDDTFKSAKADVKCSLLFLNKFTDQEKGIYDAHRSDALHETQNKYAVHIQAETERFDKEIAQAKFIENVHEMLALTKKRRDYIKEMQGRIRIEARALLRNKFDYTTFLYEAQHVGITATGEPEVNELFSEIPSNLPPDIPKTCLELWHDYKNAPVPFILDASFAPLKQRSIVINRRSVTQWDMKAARAAALRLMHPTFEPLGNYVEEMTVLVRPFDAPELDWPVYGVNNREGVVFSHFQKGNTFNAPYKRIQKDWFFHNPTRAAVGSLGIVPDVPKEAITSPEYQVWRIKDNAADKLLPGYVAALISTRFFIDLIQVHRVGAVKQRLYTENLLEICVPIPPIEVQIRITEARTTALKAIADAYANAARIRAEVEATILGGTPIPDGIGEEFEKGILSSIGDYNNGE